MLNITAGQVNNLIFYVDTISNDAITFGDDFLIGFQSTYTKKWYYVIPDIITRNSRYVKLRIDVPSVDIDDPANANIYLFPPGNFTYKLWNMVSPSLDPATGDQQDQGQMYLNPFTPPEIQFISYTDSNEDLSNIIYYSGGEVGCIINQFNSPYIVQGNEESNCDPLYVDLAGFLVINDNSELYINSI
jgi:hypothetical protein